MTKTKKVISYKGFDKDLKCRGFQYEVGKTYKHKGEVSLCNAGFHACDFPLDVFDYYPPANSEYAIVEQSGQIVDGGDKRVSSTLKIKTKITIAELIEASVEWISKKAGKNAANVAMGAYSKAASSGYSSKAASSGASSKAASAGAYSKAASVGDYSKAASSGASSTAASSGASSMAASAGAYSKAASAGDYSMAASVGDCSKAASAGDYSMAASSGESSTAASVGDCSMAASAGKSCITMVAGLGGRVKTGPNGCFALGYYDVTQKRPRILMGHVGEDGIKADTWYEVVNAKLVEVTT